MSKSLRESVADKLQLVYPNYRTSYHISSTDSILSLISERINAVENPYKLKTPFESNTNFSWRAFEACRETILMEINNKIP